ncbi:MAG: hypothetical protein Kow0063_18780 [Anaerolineae bacterium]
MDSVDNRLKAWIEAAGYRHHPFDERYLYAEDDEHLEDHFTRHTGCFEDYACSGSSVIIGARGSGKTANCIKLEEELRKDSGNFVLVYDASALWESSDELPTLKHHLREIIRLATRQLLETQADFLSPQAGRELRDLDAWCERFRPQADYRSRLALLIQTLIETGYDAVYLLIDERQTSRREPKKAPRLLAPLLDESLFNLEKVYIKLFVPDCLEDEIRQLAAEIQGVQISTIHWTADELNYLLQSLLSRARASAKGDPFGQWLPASKELERITQFPFSSEIDEEFIQKLALNDLRPRSLIQLGWLLFEECGRNWAPGQSEKIELEHWTAALERWLNSLSVKTKLILLGKVALRFVKCGVRRGKVWSQVLVQENPHDLITLPFSLAELWSVLWALERYAFDASVLPADSPHLANLKKLKFLQKSAQQPTLVPNVAEQVGEQLYQCLVGSRYFKQAIEQELKRVRDFKGRFKDRGIDTRVWLEFRFDPDAMDAASYPWELIHDSDMHLLQRGTCVLTRYIHLGEEEPSLELRRPLTLLYSAPRAGQDDLSFDQARIEDAFRSFGVRCELTRHTPPTFGNMKRIARGGYHQVWHFDGHGTFRRWCSICKKRVAPWLEKCPLGHVTEGPFGYLQLENVQGRSDYRRATEILPALYDTGLRLALVNGCKTSAQAMAPAFGGIASSLIRARIPAVVAMQLSIIDPAAEFFVGGFYTTLADALEGGNLSNFAAAKVLIKAVDSGRQHMLDATDDNKAVEEMIHRQWFIPVIYLRYDAGGHT